MKIRTTTLLLLAMSLAACAGDEPQNTIDDTSLDVKLSVSVGSLSRSNPIGTPEQQRTFNAGDTITMSDGKTKTKYVYDGTDWVGLNGVYLKWSGQPMTFSARHGYSMNAEKYIDQLDEWWVEPDQSTYRKLSDADFMYGEAHYDATTADRRVHIVLKRKTARIIVRIAEFKDQFAGKTPKVESVYINSSFFIPQGMGASFVSPYKQGDGGVGTTYTALISPGNDGIYAECNVICEGKTYPFYINYDMTTEEGKSYTFNLSVGNKVVATDVTVNDWTDGGVLDEKTLDENPGYDIDNDGTYHIYFPNGLYNIATEINAGIKTDRKIVLENDIDISQYANWTPIGSGGVIFSGTFNGNGHTISGMNIDVETAPEYLGLFGCVAGSQSGSVENIHVSGKISVKKANNASIGGIIGYSPLDVHQSAFSRGCHSDVDFEIDGNNVTNSAIGGVIGSCNVSNGTRTLRTFYYTGTMKGFSNDGNDGNSVAGIIGKISAETYCTFYFKACYTRATINHPRYNTITNKGNGCTVSCTASYYEAADELLPADTNGATRVYGNWADAMSTMNSELNGSGFQYIPGQTAKVPLIAIKK